MKRRQGRSCGERSARALALALLAGAALWTGGCLGPSHAPEALTRTGFRSPLQTFETFFAAFDYRIYALEFRCLSADFRRRNRISEITWREFRDQLEREHPLLRLAARVEVVEERSEGPGTHWIVARAAGRTVRLRFVREDFYEIYEGKERVLDGSLPRATPWTLDPATSELSTRVALAPEDAATLNDASISEFRVGYEWKLDDFLEDTADRP
ncbi:MAG: hypothetical protein IT453_02230 [Planctomycetes bacterium]|nr:hypothetical protein [Planctomycetota bacterium]